MKIQKIASVGQTILIGAFVLLLLTLGLMYHHAEALHLADLKSHPAAYLAAQQAQHAKELAHQKSMHDTRETFGWINVVFAVLLFVLWLISRGLRALVRSEVWKARASHIFSGPLALFLALDLILGFLFLPGLLGHFGTDLQLIFFTYV